jgi:hypothetical protein
LSFSIPRCRGWNGLLVAAGSASSSDPRTLAGHSPLPSAPLSGGPWVPSATLPPAHPVPQRQTCRRQRQGRNPSAALNAATRGTLRNQAADMSSASPLHPVLGCFERGNEGVSRAGCSRSRGGIPLSGPAPEACGALRNTVQPPRCSCLPRPRRVLPAPRCLIGDRHVVGARHPYGVRAVGGPLGARPDRAADMSSASPWGPVGPLR